MSTHQTNKQTQRRIKYGLNTAIAIIASIAIVIIINMIGYQKLFRLRIDLTATRQYSLSQQTLKVLQNLKGDYQIVTLLARSTPYHEQARDLIEEYAHYSNNVTVESINPQSDITRLEKFYTQLKKRYETSLAPLEKAVSAGQQTLAQVRSEVKTQMLQLRQLVASKTLPNKQANDFVQQVAQAFARFDTQEYDVIDKQIKQAINQPLPNHATAINTLKAILDSFDQKIYALAIKEFERITQATDTSPAAKDQLLRLTDQFKNVKQKIEKTLAKLRAIETNKEYDNLRKQLATADAIVILGNKQVRVVALKEMFREPSKAQMRQLEPGQQPELQFLGEERITGALVAMSLDHQPLVVFVNGDRRPALGYQGQYNQVAQRLRTMNFEVKEWSPAGGKPNPMTGQPSPPQPAPTPDVGQKAIWIILPIPPSNPMMMAQGVKNQGKQIATFTQSRLESGDGVMIISGPSPGARFGSPDPMGDIYKIHHLQVQNDRIIFNEITLQNRRTRADPTMRVAQWPSELPITTAIAGMDGVFPAASPIVLLPTDQGTNKTWPLAIVRGSRLWAESDLTSNQMPKYKPQNAHDQFTVAVAAEQANHRLIVVSDAAWASDQITTYGPMGPGSAELFGASFPANAELFINSTLWLSHLDQLIAASARSQDIRRIKAISPQHLATLRWSLFLLLPGFIAVMGLSVWAIRRRV